LREKEYIKQRYCAIISSVGMILVLLGLVMLTPLLVLPAYPGEAGNAWAFALPACGLGLAGLWLKKLFRTASHKAHSIQEGGMIVLISWIVAVVFSALPFMFLLGHTFSQAVFEAVSGWTTTGLSVVDVTKAGPMILLWRSITQLAGGAGLAVIMMSAIVGPTGVGISVAEGRGDQLVPQVRQSARLVLIIYAGYAVVGTLSYWAVGMSFFDAVNHTFAAISTGGFSTHVENIGYWDSPAVEAVSIPLMLIGNMSFVTAWSVLRGRFRFVIRNGEVRVMAVLIPLSAMAVLIFTCQSIYPGLAKATRVAAFETISALTTTGFQTVGYGNWNDFGIFILILLMLIGGGTCSTAGGVKQFRVYLLWKLLVWEIARALLPRAVIMERPIWEDDRRVFVDDIRVRQVGVFVFLYSAAYLLGVLVMCGYGYSLKEALFEFASAISNSGLSVGVVSPQMPCPAMWALTLAMFLGRLEFLVVITSLIKLVGDGRRLMTATMKQKGG
jgi:trk system potassium uptake protein TrkH